MGLWGEASTRSLLPGEICALSSAALLTQVLWAWGLRGGRHPPESVFKFHARREMRACAQRDAATLAASPRAHDHLSFVLSRRHRRPGRVRGLAITQTQYSIGSGLAIKALPWQSWRLRQQHGGRSPRFILGILESFSIWVMPTAYKERSPLHPAGHAVPPARASSETVRPSS